MEAVAPPLIIKQQNLLQPAINKALRIIYEIWIGHNLHVSQAYILGIILKYQKTCEIDITKPQNFMSSSIIVPTLNNQETVNTAFLNKDDKDFETYKRLAHDILLSKNFVPENIKGLNLLLLAVSLKLGTC